MESNAIKLNEIVAPAFYNVFWDILDGKHTYYDLYGGRGSTKSSFVGGMIPFQMIHIFLNRCLRIYLFYLKSTYLTFYALCPLLIDNGLVAYLRESIQ